MADTADVAAVTASRPGALGAAIGHAALLVERLLVGARRLGLVPRTVANDDLLGPLCITDEDVGTLLAGLLRPPPPGGDDLELERSRDALRTALADPDASLGLARLVQALELSETEVEAVVLCLAPDLDSRFGRLFGFLNNDATRTRPTLGSLETALGLGRPQGWPTRIERLLQLGLVKLPASEQPLVLRALVVPAHVAQLCRASLQPEPEPERPGGWDGLHHEGAEGAALRLALASELRRAGDRPLVLLQGPVGCGRSAALAVAAAEAGQPLVRCDLRAGGAVDEERLLERVEAACLAARVSDGALALRSDGVLGEEPELLARVIAAARGVDARCFLLVRRDELASVDVGAHLVQIHVPPTRPRQRRAVWAGVLHDRGLELSADLLDEAASRYELTPGRIHALGDELQARAEARGERRVTLAGTRDALRAVTSQRLMGLASRVDADLTLTELVLQPQVRERLDELAARVRFRYRVLSEWRFGSRNLKGYGVAALFAGPPGTGKTAAAAAVAAALEIDLFVVNLSAVVSKWVGETEQNLARVFDEAESSNVALLFDEADSLFGKRSGEMKTSTDRFANLTINYLLQRMETYAGLAILTTNLESALDVAFGRRITTRVVFPAPDEDYREKLWRQLLPSSATYADGVDLTALAREFEMPGARIRNAITRAAFRAAADGRSGPAITQSDLLWAAALEYQDMGFLAPGARER